MLYGEFLQLAAYYELAAFLFLITGCQIGISFKSLLFMHIMEYKMIISFCNIHNYGAFGIDMF